MAGATDPRDRNIREQAVATALGFLLAESARAHSKERRRRDKDLVMRLRDSLMFRSEALFWHAAFLPVLRNSGNRRLSEVKQQTEEEFHLLMSVGSEQQFLFDDLIFNALALFDYIGNLVGFAFYGEQRKKAKWDRIQKYARDEVYEARHHPAARIARSRAGVRIRAAHTELVEDLSDYRADLIHYEALVGTGTYRIDFHREGRRADLRVVVPASFAKRFTVPGFEADPAKAPLIDAAAWIERVVTATAIEILRELERDLREEAGLDPDGTEGAVEII